MYKRQLDSYVKPDGSLSTDGSENYEQVPGTWVVNFTLKGKDTYADKFVETKGTVTVTVGNKTATGALSFEYAGKDLALTNLEHNYDGKDWGETAAKVFDPANMTVKYDNNAITDYSLYTAELFYNSNAADAKDVKVGDQATGYTVKDAGTYTLVVTYDPQEPNTDPVVDKTQTFTVAPYDLKTLKLVNLSMEYADPAPKATAVDVYKRQDLVILEKEFEDVSSKVVKMSDDGTWGQKGLVTNALEQLIKEGNQYDEVIAIGPLVMMKFVAKLTKEYLSLIHIWRQMTLDFYHWAYQCPLNREMAWLLKR